MPAKRRRLSSPGDGGDVISANSGSGVGSGSLPIHTGLNQLFSLEELFLRVLSFLSPLDLARAQGVNRYWARMSLDPQLWKRLYLERYPHPHHSRLVYTRSGASTPLRPIARLPSRAFPPPSPSPSPSPALPMMMKDFGDESAAAASSSSLHRHGTARILATRDDKVGNEVIEEGRRVRNDGVDWKMMMRLGTNWSNGNALREISVTLPPSPQLTGQQIPDTPRSQETGIGRSSIVPSTPPYTEHHLALFPTFICTSDPSSPLVHVHPSAPSSRPTAQELDLSNSQSLSLGIIPPPPGWSSPSRPDNVTAICADQSVVLPDPIDSTGATEIDSPLTTQPPKPSFPARLAIFYQSGGFVLVRIRLVDGRLSWTREAVHAASRSRPRRRLAHATANSSDPVVLAALYYPVLVTCTIAFHLSVYTLAEPTPKHIQTLRSDVSFHPAALSLFPPHDDDRAAAANSQPRSRQYRATLTYCTPLYPSSWTVAVQELGIDLGRALRSGGGSGIGIGDDSEGDVWRGECYHVSRPDTDEVGTWPRRIEPLVGVRGRAVGIGTDGRWCVIAGEDSLIQVFSLPTPGPTPVQTPLSNTSPYYTPAATPLTKYLPTRFPGSTHSITHAQTLLAHSAAVTSISLASGRCVSGSRDGRVLVWELDDGLDEEEDEGVEAEGEGGSGKRGEARLGRTVGYVEVKPGGRRPRIEIDARYDNEDEDNDGNDSNNDNDEDGGRGTTLWTLPHPTSISAAARNLFLAQPPASIRPASMTTTTETTVETTVGSTLPPAIRQLAFDEEKIVGLVNGGRTGSVMRVWSFG